MGFSERQSKEKSLKLQLRCPVNLGMPIAFAWLQSFMQNHRRVEETAGGLK
jgi:hypothetical protein